MVPRCKIWNEIIPSIKPACLLGCGGVINGATLHYSTGGVRGGAVSDNNNSLSIPAELVGVESGPWAGRDIRYQPGKAYLIDLCEITRAEQTAMDFLFGDAEKKRRQRAKKGARSMDIYLASHNHNQRLKSVSLKQQAQDLHAQGVKVGDIANQLGKSRQTIYRYLKM